jgi:serine/threonine protein kinase
MTVAHGLGIVHRDLKPSNLFLAREGEALRIKVLDFGISKVESEGDVKMTVTSSVLGTPLYMSPEQIRSAKNVDERTDIWSLGVILYELLSGRPPFDCESATGLAAAIVADDVKPVGELRPELPAGLAAVVMKALEKKPERRFQTVLELGQALAPFGPESARVALRAAPASAPRPLRLLPANAASPTAPTLERADTLVAAPGSVPTSTPATEPGWDATPSATRNRGGRAALLALAAASALALGGAAWLALGGAESPPDAARVLPAEPAASRPLASADPELAPSPPSPSSVPAVTPAPLESAQIGPRPSAAARAKPSAKAGAGAAEAAPPKAPAAPPPTATNPNRL